MICQRDQVHFLRFKYYNDVFSFSAFPFCFSQVLKCEVELMAKMAKTIDSFTQNQTRLVVIIDGLDACEQDKVLQMLDTVSWIVMQR